MSHTLTEADSFAATVTVPDGTDSRNTAAEVVEAIAQALANRTKNLNLHSAKKDAANTFTAAPQKVNQTDASLAALVVDATADQHPSIPANVWKAFLSGNVGDNGGYNNTYAGVRTGPGQYIHVINAVWDVANQWWVADNTSVDSLALIFDVSTGLFISRRPAGAGHWTTWPGTAGNLLAGGNVQINGALQVSGNITLVTGQVLYATPFATSRPLNLAGGNNLVQAGDEYTAGPGAAGLPRVPVIVPDGAVITGVDCITNQAISAAGTIWLYRRTGNYSSPGAPTVTPLSSATPAATSGYKSFSLSSGLPVSTSHLVEYYIEWVPGNAADTIVSARVNYNELGPGN